MSAAPAAKRARAHALDATVSTLEVPGLGVPNGMFVMADGTRLVSTEQNTLQLLTPAGLLANIAGDEDEEEGFEDGKGANARFSMPGGMTVDAAGHIVVADPRKPRPAPRVQDRRGQHAGRQRGVGLSRRAGRCRALPLP